MKNLVTFTTNCLLMAGMVLTSCSKDTPDGPVVTPPEEGTIPVQLIIQDDNVKTRAYLGTETAITGEIELADNVAVYVYNENGTLDYQNLSVPVSLQGSDMVTDEFRVNQGVKYFYVFSNGQNQPQTLGANWDDMEKHVARVTFPTDNSMIPSVRPEPIAVHGAMTIGTLWRGTDMRFDIQPYGMVGAPQKVDLTVGRATAKVRLVSISPGTTPLLGTFSTDPVYRLRSVPDRYYVVGQLDNSGSYPPTTGLRYISAVDTETPGTLAFPSDVFIDYKWEHALDPDANTTDDAYFYAVENTTAKGTSQNNPAGDFLYYGNTTYIQFEIAYAPGGQEVYDPANPATPDGTAMTLGDTFWTALHNGEFKMFNDNPSILGAAVDEIKEYQNGIMYYKFPIRDPRESGTELQCCVIRNHYYEITVDNIRNLGEPTDEVDPEEPIDDEDPTVEITVKVEDWYKVTQGVDL